MRAAHLPSGSVVVYALAVWEIFAASVVLGAGGRAGGVALALTYSAFAAFIAYALHHRLPIQSCGCFGRSDTPPSGLHVGFNLVATASGLWVAAFGGSGLVSTLSDQPAAGLLYVGFLGLGVYAAFLVLAELPRTLELGRRAV